MMSTTTAAAITASRQADSTIGSGSASVTRLPGKASKSGIPRSPSTPGAGPKSALPRPEVACTGPSAVDGMVAENRGAGSPKRGDRVPRGRASALPTFAGPPRVPTKKGSNTSGPKLKPEVSSVAQKRHLEKQLTIKRQRYMTLTKKLAEQEEEARVLYDDVSELRDKVMAAGLEDPGKVESVALGLGRIERTARPVFGKEVAAPSERLLGCTASSASTSEFIGTLEGKLNEIPNLYQEVCREVLRQQTEIKDWIAGFSRRDEPESGSEITGRLERLEIEGADLPSRLEEAAGKHRAIITELMQKASALWGERENYRIHIRELESTDEGLVGDLKEKLRATIEELAEERERATRLKERKSAADVQLQKARTRIRELEGQTNGAEARLQQLQGTVKSLEVQLRQKDAVLEGRNKEMHRALRNSEGLVARTEKQRDSLESRVTELKRKIDSKGAELNGTIENLTKRLEDADNQLAVEKELKCQAERRATELAERCAKLEEKSKQLCDLAEGAKGLAIKSGNAEGTHTDSELRLWNELRSSRSALAAQGEQLLEIRREKEQILSVLRQAADRDDPGCVKDKLAAELVAKTEELRKAAAERTQLQRNLDNTVDKSNGLERQLSELHGRLHAQSKEGGKTGWSAHAFVLQQQLCDLRATLADLTRYNEELETALTQKQLELEQRDRVMQEQSKVLKVRDELIGLLKEQSPNANGEPNEHEPEDIASRKQALVDPEAIDRLIAAKAEDLEALYRVLEGKQMQLTRLEKVVRQMEDENERSQATRTKLEREVARLRLQLNEKNRDQRYVRGATSSEVLCDPGKSPPPVRATEPPIGPISSWRLPEPRAKSACGRTTCRRGITPWSKTPSGRNLKDMIRAVVRERARGAQRGEGGGSRIESRSLRPSPVRNSTEPREDLYNWLMQPAAGSRGDA